MNIKNILKILKNKSVSFFTSLVLKESSPEKMALSFAMGVYIAICPFVGFHTAMIFIFAWMFRLNTAVTFTTGYIINNIFTLIPIFLADYSLGYWLLHKVFLLQTNQINPFWVNYINNFLYRKLNIPNACFWSFMVGGNILAISAAVFSYPIAKYFAKYIKNKRKNNKNMDVL